jgi:hypothetical protein
LPFAICHSRFASQAARVKPYHPRTETKKKGALGALQLLRLRLRRLGESDRRSQVSDLETGEAAHGDILP